MIDCSQYEEKMKHRKKRVKKAPKKADHKHEYIDFIGRKKKEYFDSLVGHKGESEYAYVPIKKCSICGKIENTHFAFTKEIVSNGRKYRQMLFELEDIKKEYPELDIVDMNDDLSV